MTGQKSVSAISIMIVDDHTMFRQALGMALGEHDNLVVLFEAASGEDALEILANNKPDVILMDISLPGMNGIEAIRQVVALRPTKVIAISMHDKDTYEPAVLEAGARAYVFKGSPIGELVSLIEKVAHAE